MKHLIFEAPSNSLSFGNVSFNLLREMYKKKINVSFFPIGGKLDLEAYDKIDPEFRDWIQSCVSTRLDKLSGEVPTLKLWHLNGSEMRIGKHQTLYTFYELDTPTLQEQNIASLQNHICFSSSYAHEKFERLGIKNGSVVPVGFDTDFHKVHKTYLPEKLHFGLMGKWEKRKNTAQIIQAWAEKYGNNYKYQLSCCVTNRFFKADQMNQVIGQCLKGKRYGNINFIPYLQTNSEVNDFLNAIDIDLSGLSGAEGWNLPSFNSTALGKWSIVLNCTSHTDWATQENSILVEPDGKEPIYDNVFFSEGQPFNQGNKYKISSETIIEKMELAETSCRNPNTEGEKLRKKFTYKKTLEGLLSSLTV